jgi:hypothetical protein
MSQVPLIFGFSSMPSDVQSSMKILIDYLNAQDMATQAWSRMSIQGFFQTRVNPVSAAYSISDLDQIVLVDSTSGTVAITLPSAATMPGRRYTVKDWKGQSATHNITVGTTASQKIDGSSTSVLSTNYQAIEVASDGANWAIISNK